MSVCVRVCVHACVFWEQGGLFSEKWPLSPSKESLTQLTASPVSVPPLGEVQVTPAQGHGDKLQRQSQQAHLC